LVEVTLPVVFHLRPLVVAVTATVTVQMPLAAIGATREDDGRVARRRNEHRRAAAGGGGVGRRRHLKPGGERVGERTPVRAVPAFGLVIVKVSVLTPLTATGFGENALAMLGAETTTSVSMPVLAGAAVGRGDVAGGVELGAAGGVGDVDGDQAAVAGGDRAAREADGRAASCRSEGRRAAAAGGGVGVAATWRPAGKLSVKATPVKVVPAFCNW
jgi:hypothetical protein